MKVSILLTTYQGEKYLPDLLASLCAQEEGDFEILYQDDGSTDGTLSLLQQWEKKDARLRPGKHQGEHLGVIGNFFSLLSQADGDLIFFCDQDDLWEPHKISTLKQAYLAAESDPSQPLLVHSDASVIDEAGNQLSPSFFRLQGWDPAATGLNRLLVQNNVTGCMMLINRPLAELALKHGDPNQMFMHDWFLALTAAAFGRILFVDQPMTRYRQHAHNQIGASRRSLFARGLQAFRERDRARQRIRLTYTHTADFAQAYGNMLPSAAKELIEAYLATESQPKLLRLHNVHRLGCLMQSPITRLGQIFFG